MHHESWGFLHTLPASSSIPVLLIVSLFLVQSDSFSTWVLSSPYMYGWVFRTHGHAAKGNSAQI